MLPRRQRKRLLLGFEGQVKVFDPAAAGGLANFIGQSVIEQALGLDRFEYKGLALSQRAELPDALLDRHDLFRIEPPRLVLAEPRNKRNRVPGIQQLNSMLDFFRWEFEVAGDDNNIFGHRIPDQTRVAAGLNCHIPRAEAQLPIRFQRLFGSGSQGELQACLAGWPFSM